MPFAHAVNPDDLLPAEQAFKLSTNFVNPQTLRVQWEIADGYYMYRKRFDFKTDTTDVQLEPAVFPAGKIKKDEFFGEMETYRHQVVIDIPVTRTIDGATAFKLTAISQGCADLGVCYPPQTQTVALELPSQAAENGSTSAVKDFFNSLGAKVGAGLGLSNPANKFLEPDKAYRASFDVQDDANTLNAQWDIADGYYMYRDKFAFRLINAEGARLGAAQLPPGEPKTDEAFGKTEVYHNNVSIPIPLLRESNEAAKITLEATYQGCAEAGFCYPPLTKTVDLSLPAISSAALATGNLAALPEQDRIARALASDNLALTLLTFFGFGLLLAFTPCVFPMIPILSSIIVGQGAGQNTRKAFTLSLVYVLAMALTYTVIGVIAGRFGENLQAASQNPWILGTFSAVFVLLALSMFGFYQLQLPASLQTKLATLSNRQRGGTLAGVAVMGFLSALIVGPCVAAPLAGALIYIGQSGDAVLGGLALFAMGMGMGTPLLAIGTSLGKWLPRAGGWMDVVKVVFGVLLLAVALWMLERILPATLSMLLWAVLLIVSAVYMGALERLGPDASGWRTLWKGLGFILLIYGALILVGAASGGKDVLRPLENLVASDGNNSTTHTVLAFKQIKGVDGLKREIAAASAQGKPAMLDFYADWCVACKEMEKYTFSDAAVQQALSGAVLLQADVTANDDIDKALLKHLGLIGPPSILFFGPDGMERTNYRLVGFLNAEEFLSHIKQSLPASDLTP
jgi:thiol:disulfide interchange protein DsbD